MLIIIEKSQCQVILGIGNRICSIVFLLFIQYLSISLTSFVHFSRDFYSPTQVYSSVTILFIVVACFGLATNGEVIVLIRRSDFA